MAFDYDETNPTDNSYIADFPANERDHRADVLASVDIDHYAEAGPATPSQDGFHRQVSMPPSAGDPAQVGNAGFVYTKDVAGITELFYMDEDGTVTQLTSDGTASPDKLPLAGGTMTGDLIMNSGDILLQGTSLVKLLNAKYLQARNAADSAWLALLGVDALDVSELGNINNAVRLKTDTIDNATILYGATEKKIYHAGHFDPPIFTTEYESAETAFSLSGSGTVPHSIGSIPKLWKVFLRCKTANNGYAVNEELEVGGNPQNSPRGLYCSVTSTQFEWRAGTDQAKICTTSGGSAELEPAKWKLVFRAWY